MDWRRVGERIRELRKRYAMNQDDVCTKLGISRPILIDIESGARAPTVDQLIRLGEICGGRPYTYFLEAPAKMEKTLNLQPLYRLADMPVKKKTIEKNFIEMGNIIEEFEKRIQAFLFVANEVAMKLPQDWYEIRNMCKHAGEKYQGEDNRIRYAKQLASFTRIQLGYGDKAPAKDLKTRLEDIGIITFLVDRPAQFDGASCVFEDPDAKSDKYAFICVGKSRIPRMRFTLAHELAHVLNHKANAYLDRTLYDKKTFQEFFANHFAAEFLMPEAAIRERWQNTGSTKETLDRGLQLAAHFGVTLDAIAVRLEALGLVEQGTRNKVKAYFKDIGGGPDKMKKSRMQSFPKEEYWHELPMVYETMCVELFRREEISEARLGELLFRSQVEAVEQAQQIMNQYAMDEKARPMDGWSGRQND